MEQNVKVQSEEYLENGVLYQSYKIQSIQNIPHANLQQFRCEICNEIFADSTHLEEHYKIHSDKEKIETTIDKQYIKGVKKTKDVEQEPTEEALVSEDTMFNCDLCPRKFKYYHCFVFHRKVMHEEIGDSDKVQFCAECSEAFMGTKQLEEHLLNCHKIVMQKSSYKCDACSNLFITYGSLLHHQEKMHFMQINQDFEIKMKCATCKQLIEAELYKKQHRRMCKEQRRKKSATSSAKEFISSNEELSGIFKVTQHEKNVSKTDGGSKKQKSSFESRNVEIEKKESPGEIISEIQAILAASEGSNDVVIENIE